MLLPCPWYWMNPFLPSVFLLKNTDDRVIRQGRNVTTVLTSHEKILAHVLREPDTVFFRLLPTASRSRHSNNKNIHFLSLLMRVVVRSCAEVWSVMLTLFANQCNKCVSVPIFIGNSVRACSYFIRTSLYQIWNNRREIIAKLPYYRMLLIRLFIYVCGRCLFCVDYFIWV